MREIGNLPVVSVICPLYNAAAWLKKGKLKCVQGQTYNDWELILVDDGSTDETFALCVEMAKDDKRVRPLHQPNCGAGIARNNGMDAARGKYIYFFDIDDEIEPTLLAYCVEQMERHHADMLVFSFEAVTLGQNLHEDVLFRNRVCHTNDELKGVFVNDLVLVRYGNGFVWNKFYRHSLIKKCSAIFPQQRIQEDELFNLMLYPNIERLIMADRILYHYYLYPSGNTQSRFFPNLFDMYVTVHKYYECLLSDWLNGRDNTALLNHLNSKAWREIYIALGFNLFHRNCPWTKKEKQEELERVTAHPYTKNVILWKKENGLSVEDYLRLYAYTHNSIFCLSALNGGRHFFHKLKHLILAS